MINCLHDVYTERSQGKISGLLEQYIYNQKLGKSPNEVPDAVFEAINPELVPNVLFAEIVMSAHLSDNITQYYKQYGWAFEQLVNECCPAGYPSPRLFSTEQIAELTSRIINDTTALRETIENSARLRRHADSRYLTDTHLREGVVELLARSVMYAGPDAIRELREAGKSTAQIEQIFDRRLEYLPVDKRRAVEPLL